MLCAAPYTFFPPLLMPVFLLSAAHLIPSYQYMFFRWPVSPKVSAHSAVLSTETHTLSLPAPVLICSAPAGSQGDMFPRKQTRIFPKVLHILFPFLLQAFLPFSDSLPLRVSVLLTCSSLLPAPTLFAVSSLSPALPPPMLSALRHTVFLLRQEMDTQASHGSVPLFSAGWHSFALLLFSAVLQSSVPVQNQLPLSRLPAQASAFLFSLPQKQHTPDRAFLPLQPLSFLPAPLPVPSPHGQKASPDPDGPLNRRPGMDSPRSDFLPGSPPALLKRLHTYVHNALPTPKRWEMSAPSFSSFAPRPAPAASAVLLMQQSQLLAYGMTPLMFSRGLPTPFLPAAPLPSHSAVPHKTGMTALTQAFFSACLPLLFSVLPPPPAAVSLMSRTSPDRSPVFLSFLRSPVPTAPLPAAVWDSAALPQALYLLSVHFRSAVCALSIPPALLPALFQSAWFFPGKQKVYWSPHTLWSFYSVPLHSPCGDSALLTHPLLVPANAPQVHPAVILHFQEAEWSCFSPAQMPGRSPVSAHPFPWIFFWDFPGSSNRCPSWIIWKRSFSARPTLYTGVLKNLPVRSSRSAKTGLR